MPSRSVWHIVSANPSLGENKAGVYGYPAREAAKIAVRTVRAWSAAHPEADITVTLVAFSPAAFELYRKELARP